VDKSAIPRPKPDAQASKVLAMIEALIQIVGELFIQIFGEVLVELGMQSLQAPFRKQASPWLAAPGYAILGALAGLSSLWFLPHHLTPAGGWRIVNLIATPIIAGACMALIGGWRSRRGQTLVRLDKFSYGFLFALAWALVRLAGAN
jgi:hypothetical protein